MNEHPVEQNSKKWIAPFFTIWSGQAVSLLGSQLVQFTLIWWLTQTTKSATVLATAALVGLLPQVLLGPVAGALVDRWSRRVVMIVADAIIALATFGLAVLFLTGNVQIWHVYLMMFIRALGGGFHWPAMQASTSLMVPKEHLSRIQGLNQMLHGGMNIGSAPLGALLLAFLPMQSILVIDVGTALLAILPLFFIQIPEPARSASTQAPGGKTSIGQDLRAGLRYVWAWPGLMMIMVMATLINLLLTPATTLLPILVIKHFGGQAFELAWIESVWGIGVVVGGLILGAWGGFRRRVLTSLAGLIVLGAVMAAIGVVPASLFWLALVLFFVSGVTNPMVNGPLLATVQAVVTPEMQGRVFTLLLSAAGAMTPLGLVVAGPAVDRLGVQTWFIAGGVVTALLGIMGFFIPAIVNIEDGNNAESHIANGLIDDSAVLSTGSPVEISGD